MDDVRPEKLAFSSYFYALRFHRSFLDARYFVRTVPGALLTRTRKLWRTDTIRLKIRNDSGDKVDFVP